VKQAKRRTCSDYGHIPPSESLKVAYRSIQTGGILRKYFVITHFNICLFAVSSSSNDAGPYK
jgi:hypothetical protein